jgi:hypothetical protein
LRLDEEIGIGVSDHVVDGVERFIFGLSQGAGRQSANEEGTEEARASSDGNAINVIPGYTGGFKGFVDDGQDGFDVATGSDFGDNATVLGMDVYLGCDYV